MPSPAWGAWLRALLGARNVTYRGKMPAHRLLLCLVGAAELVFIKNNRVDSGSGQ